MDVHSGSSPHTRGARRSGQHDDRQERIIPAYAGSTSEPTQRSSLFSDHPRIRGEHVVKKRTVENLGGSSPHTRGARRQRPVRDRRARIIPAYAGSTGPEACISVRTRDHPRIRGEHSIVVTTHRFPRGSSPHTRGAPTRRTLSVYGIRIIPAYAGSTRSGRFWRRCREDHPRIRGEHAW